jgi:hypothetical protein
MIRIGQTGSKNAGDDVRIIFKGHTPFLEMVDKYTEIKENWIVTHQHIIRKID